MLELPKVDLLVRVVLAEEVVKVLVLKEKVPGMCSVCASGMREAAAQKVKEVKESQANLFC
jgi:hypothetical protein